MPLGALLAIAGSYGLGCALTRRVDCPWPVRFCAGACVLSLLVFALLLAGVGRPPVLAGVALLAAGGIALNPPKLRRPNMPWWAAALFLLYGGLYVATALGPETETDPNVYHLTAAREAMRHGGLSKEISFYERLPHAVELLFAIAFPFGGVKLVHLAFLIATLPLLVRLGGYPAALLYFLAPVVAVSGTSAFNDAALVCVTVAMVVTLKDDGPTWLAGLLAGFCYAIKMTGGLAIPVGLAMLLWRKRWRRVLVFAACAMIPVLPWVLRNWIETGNPTAPLFNAWFPNPYFHVSTERAIMTGLRTYGVAIHERFTEVLWGVRLQGMVGPAFFLAPLALVSPLAVVMTLPWWLNAGARFLMPALPFIAVAITKRLPQWTSVGLVVVQAVAAFPPLLERWQPHAWRITAYSRPVTWDARVAHMIAEHTTPPDRIFDIHGVHAALVDRQFFGSWHSARNERSLRAIEFAREPGKQELYTMTAEFRRRSATALRIQLRGVGIGEVDLYDGAFRIPNRTRWSLDAFPNPFDTPQAFDGNLATRWLTYDEPRSGQYFLVDFEGVEELTRIVLTGTIWDGPPPHRIELRDAKGSWSDVPARFVPLPPRDLRKQAVANMKRDGFTHIVARSGTDGAGSLGYILANSDWEWGLERVGMLDNVYLFRIP